MHPLKSARWDLGRVKSKTRSPVSISRPDPIQPAAAGDYKNEAINITARSDCRKGKR